MALRLTWFMFCIFCYSTCVNGERRVVCPSQTVLAIVGDTVVLPCRIELPMSATDLTTEWSRTESHIKPQYVYIRRNGYAEEDPNLNELYRGQRCSVSEEKLAGGDLSLELRGLHLSDEGTYRCKVPDPQTHLGSRSCVIKLRIGNASQPEINSAGPKDTPLISGVDAGLPGHIIAAIVIGSLCAVRALIFLAMVGWNWQKNLQRANWEKNLQRDAEAV